MAIDHSHVPTPAEILRKLQEKLAANHSNSVSAAEPDLDQVELRSRAFALLGQVLREDTSLQAHQRELVPIFDELFADVLLSVHLAACCLEKPAELVLRRALELGVAVLYLWDDPHTFYAWRSHDKDLSFREMIERVCGDVFRTLIHAETGVVAERMPTAASVDAIYGELSDTMHGKMKTFETPLSDRFTFNRADWAAHLRRVRDVQKILLSLWGQRLRRQVDEVVRRMPALSIS